MIKILAITFFFYKYGDNETSVATFVATLIETLDTADLDRNAWKLIEVKILKSNNLMVFFKVTEA